MSSLIARMVSGACAAISVAIALLYAKAKGMLLPCMLLYAAVNNSKDIVPSATPGATATFGLAASLVGWLTVGLLWAGAAIVLVWMAKTEPERAGRYGEATTPRSEPPPGR